MIVCDKCGKVISRMLPCTVKFNNMEHDGKGHIQEHCIKADVCLDCQEEMLNALGRPFVRCYKKEDDQ